MEVLSRTDLIKAMYTLAEQMKDVATQMDYSAGFATSAVTSKLREHSKELMGAALIMCGWAEGFDEALNDGQQNEKQQA